MEISNEKLFEEKVTSSIAKLVVCYFWADFHDACKKDGQMDQVVKLLQQKHASSVEFFKIEAETLPDVCEKLGVSMVPSFVLLDKGKKVDMVEGANPAKLQSTLEKNLTVLKSSSPAEEGLNDRLKRLSESAAAVLFMKGNATEPRCKFSRQMVELLKEHDIRFASVDVLQDPAVREGMKTFSNWKTFPQLYMNGKFVGGLDTVKELGAGIKEKLSETVVAPARPVKATPPGAPPSVVTDAYLKKLISSAPCMLFMKGSPDHPSCGFSGKIVNILQENEIPFQSFDILTSDQVRQKLKTYSDWPTYPQLYVNGKLVGGLDIVEEMAEDGDLREQLGVQSLEQRLKKLIVKAPVMVFIKGVPPNDFRCNFSRQIIEILDRNEAKYETFDILQDEEVRQGLKDFSKWPTFPQLYVQGKLVGGLDIVRELDEDEELREILQPAKL